MVICAITSTSSISRIITKLSKIQCGPSLLEVESKSLAPIMAVLGPMQSGKSAWLIDQYKTLLGKKRAVRPKRDARTPLNCLESRNGQSVPCEHVENIFEVCQNCEPKIVVLIDEIHMFSPQDLEKALLIAKEKQLIIRIAGLYIDLNAEKFDHAKVIKHANGVVQHLFNICSICKRTGSSDWFKPRDKLPYAPTVEFQDLFGREEKWDSICLDCHMQKVQQFGPVKLSQVKDSLIEKVASTLPFTGTRSDQDKKLNEPVNGEVEWTRMPVCEKYEKIRRL